MMVTPIIVKILAERIVSEGLNPKTNKVLTLEDIKLEEYKRAVEDYILTHQNKEILL